MSWAGRYVGKPFAYGGRGPAEFDCWGLVKDVYDTELGVELPDYGEISADHLRAIVKAITIGHDGDSWMPVRDPQEYDVCVMRLHGSTLTGHVGVLIDTGWMLHIEEASHAVIVPVSHLSVKGRIVGYRRHRLN